MKEGDLELYIESIKIGAFAGLHDVDISLGGGMNIIEGNNESGKSTVAAFIRFALYGFEKGERAFVEGAAGENSYGSLVINDDGKRYRVERRTNARGEDCRIYDAVTGVQCFNDKVPGEVFTGLPSTVFAGTSYVSQITGSRVDGRSLGDAVDNLLFSADETVNIQKAMKKLDDARKSVLHKDKKGGRLYELESERDELKARLQKASETNAEIITLEGALDDVRFKLNEYDEKLGSLRENLDTFARLVRRRRRRVAEELKVKYETRCARLAELKEKFTRNGFFPDEEYTEQLKTVMRDIESLDDKIKTLAKTAEAPEPPENTEDDEDRKRKEYIKRSGGVEELEETLREYKIKRRTMMAFGVAFGLMFVAALVITAYLFFFNGKPLHCFLSAAGCAVLLAGMIICFISATRYSKQEDELYDSLRADDTMELNRILDGMKNPKTQDSHTSQLSRLAAERTKAEMLRAEKVIALRKLCEKWGEEEPERAIEHSEEIINACRAYSAETEKIKAQLDTAQKQLEGLEDEEEDKRPLPKLPEGFDPKAAKREYDFLTKASQSLGERAHKTEVRLAELNAVNEQPLPIEAKINELNAQIELQKQKLSAYLLASEKLGEAGAGLRESLSPKLSEYAGSVMRILTDGKYTNLGVGRELELSYGAENGGLTRGAEYMSAGTADAAYVALRLALLNVLCRDKKAPLIFDESFSRLDGERLANMLKMLAAMASEGTQIIIMTALERESELSAPYKVQTVKLS